MLEIRHRAPRRLLDHRPPLLFVHGAWHGAWCWDEHFLPYFARRGWDSYAVSLRGHGGSDGRERLRWTPLKGYVADIAEAADGLPARPVIIAHSLGGFAAQHYLARHDAPAAVLVATVPPAGSLRFVMRSFRHMPHAATASLVRVSGFPLVATPRRTRHWFFSDRMPAADVRRYAAAMQDESFRAGLDAMLLARTRPRRVRARKIPMLVVAAGADRVFSLAEARAAAKAYDAELVTVPDVAHDVMLDLHWDAAAARIAEWLERRFSHSGAPD